MSGKVSSLRIDDNIYSADNMDIVVEVVPTSFLLTDISESKIVLSSATGTIEKLRGDGTVSASGYPSASEVIIDNFVGYLNLENGNAVLRGVASSVTSSEFEW